LTAERPLLTAAMIVRNEEGFLGPCLSSLAGLADELVIVDTGSTDASRDIARSHGARLGEFPWTGDFAAARNHALDLARGEWILWIDADERVLPFPRAELERVLSARDVLACRLWFTDLEGTTPHRKIRLWRNDPRLRFQGRIHENIATSIKAVVAEDGYEIADCEMEMTHLGYEGDISAKHRRNLPLLRQRLEEAPGIISNWLHLGGILTDLGEKEEAERVFVQAVALARQSPDRHPREAACYAELARSLAVTGGEPTPSRLAEAEAVLAQGLERHPGDRYLQWVDASYRMARGRFEEAVVILERLAGIDGERFRDPKVACDKRIFGEFAFDALGLCCFRLGRHAESAAWYASAEAVAPARLEYRLRRIAAEQRARRAG